MTFIHNLIATLLVGVILVAPVPAYALEKAGASEKKQATKPATAPSAQKLHRVDFRLEGASCATCLLKIRAALRKTKGVVACEMALKKPYGGVVIYNASEIDVKKISETAVKADPRSTVIVKEQVDETIDKAPLVLIPKFNSLLPKAN